MSGRSQCKATSRQRPHEPCGNLHRRQVIDHQIKHYIRACGLRALLVVTDADRKRSFVRSARNPEIVINSLRIQYGSTLELCRVWWGAPEEIIALELAWSAASQRLDATVRGLLATARNHEIRLVPDHVVISRAYDCLDRVNLEFEDLRRNGQMFELNQAFIAASRRRPSLRYDEFAQRVKIRLLYAIVKELNI
jgi:hypothetical protein